MMILLPFLLTFRIGNTLVIKGAIRIVESKALLIYFGLFYRSIV